MTKLYLCLRSHYQIGYVFTNTKANSRDYF